jgi:hypothetical protein
LAAALEPRRNGDGSWTPSTALTVLNLGGEWVLTLLRKGEAAGVYPLLVVHPN